MIANTIAHSLSSAIVFSDGVEADSTAFNSGLNVQIGIASLESPHSQ